MTVKLQKTRDYSIFKILKGNRAINQQHVDALVKSMKDNYVPIPIHVNNKMEVIDGQHRLEAAKRLGIELYYTILEDADIKTVQRINSTSKNWTWGEYINCYADLGNQDYIHFKELVQYTGFSITTVMEMCNIKIGRVSNPVIEGNLKIPNLQHAYEIANKLKKLKPYYKGYNRRAFVGAICECMRRKDFSFDEFLQKLSYQSSKLVDCAQVSQYIDLIEDIYNYKRSDKINMRIPS